MNIDTPYPVLQELNLPAVPAKFLGRPRRDLAELPQSPPGTALVFQVDGQFHVYDEHRRLAGSEAFVTEALAVAVVNLRPYRFSTDLTSHSKHPAEDFTIQVTAEAVVDRPELVTRQGAIDLARILANHLDQDREIAEICGRRTLEDLALVRKMVDARMTAYYQHRPLYQPGIQVTLQLVEVLTPIGLVERDRATLHSRHSHTAQMLDNALSHERRLQSTDHDQEYELRTTEWERRQRHRADKLELEHKARVDAAERDMSRRAEELEWQYRTKVEQVEEEQRRVMIRLEHKNQMLELELNAERTALTRQGQDTQAEWMKKYYDAGVPGLLALAAAQGLISPLEMADLVRDDEAKAVGHIRALINGLIGEGRGDLVSVDLQTMVDTLQSKLLGRLADRPEHQAAVTGPAAEITSNEVDEDQDENPPDEDEFH